VDQAQVAVSAADFRVDIQAGFEMLEGFSQAFFGIRLLSHDDMIGGLFEPEHVQGGRMAGGGWRNFQIGKFIHQHCSTGAESHKEIRVGNTQTTAAH